MNDDGTEGPPDPTLPPSPSTPPPDTFPATEPVWSHIPLRSEPPVSAATFLPAKLPPVLEPRSTAHTVPPRRRLSKLLRLALIVVGSALMALSVLVLFRGSADHNESYMIGSVLGIFAIWPLIFIALFSIGRRFRTPRTRAIIVLAIWSLGIMGQLGNLQTRRARVSATQQESLPSDSAAAPADESNEPSPDVTAQPVPPSTATSAKVTQPAPSSSAATFPEYDFSAGSDERLTKLIDGAEEERYRAIVAGYIRACAARPSDAQVALERVRFIEHFLDAEDITMADAPKDHEAAVNYLTQRFPDNPATALHQLERLYGKAFDLEVQKRQSQAEKWPVGQQAEFLLLRANRTRIPRDKELFARGSFDAHPTVAAGLLLLEAYKDALHRAARIKLLEHPVFDSANIWSKKMVMIALFETGQTQRAMALYEELKHGAPATVRYPEMALQLASAGQVADARKILAEIPVNQWNRDHLARTRFEFELKHGNSEQASAAYRALRDTGMQADPVLRDRLSLFVKHPDASWQLRDTAGVLFVLLCVVIALSCPAVLFLPVHYWSLLRARRAKPAGWSGAKWGLRDAWATLGFLVIVTLAGVWIFQPEVVRSSFAHHAVVVAVPHSDTDLMLEEGVALLGMALVLGAALWRARAWRVLGDGEWGFGTVVGMSLAGAVALRIALLAYIAIWPGAVSGGLASFSPMTLQLCVALLKHTGPAGLILVLAVAVPVLEELLFRGVLLQAMAKHISFGSANALQAILFASLHENFRIFPFFVVFGALCGVLARRSGGLATSIGVHALNNLTACFVIMVANR